MEGAHAEDAGRNQKRRRLNDDISEDSESTTEASQAGGDSSGCESDSSIKVVCERAMATGNHQGNSDGNEDDDDDDDLDLMQVLNEADEETEGRRSSNATSPVLSNKSQAEMAGQEAPMEPIDLEAEVLEQQAVEENTEPAGPPTVHKALKWYRCPICFEPPEAAVITPCGHTFCVTCLFQMVNSSRTQRKSGLCALCRREVRFRDVKMIILKKKRVRKQPGAT